MSKHNAEKFRISRSMIDSSADEDFDELDFKGHGEILKVRPNAGRNNKKFNKPPRALHEYDDSHRPD